MKAQPKIVITGERAVHSDRPIFVLQLDGTWTPGTEATRERGKRMIARGYGYATWIYGIEACRCPMLGPWCELCLGENGANSTEKSEIETQPIKLSARTRKAT